MKPPTISPFLIAMASAALFSCQTKVESPIPEKIAKPSTKTSHEDSRELSKLKEASKKKPQLVVFLRHFGCLFAKEAISQLAKLEPQIEERGVQLNLVHMSKPEAGKAFIETYGIKNAKLISDPKLKLYKEFGLKKASFDQIVNECTIKRSKEASDKGHKITSPAGDISQLAGVFLIKDGKLKKEFRHKDAGELPDYLELSTLD